MSEYLVSHHVSSRRHRRSGPSNVLFVCFLCLRVWWGSVGVSLRLEIDKIVLGDPLRIRVISKSSRPIVTVLD